MHIALLTTFLLALPQPEAPQNSSCEDMAVHLVLPTPGPYSRVSLAPSADLGEHITITVYSGQMVASSTATDAARDTVQTTVMVYEVRLKPGTMIEAGEEETDTIMVLTPHDEKKRLMLQGGPYALQDLPLMLELIHPSHFGLGMIQTEGQSAAEVAPQFVLVLSPTLVKREVRTSSGTPPWEKEEPGWSRPDHPPGTLSGRPAQFASLKQITGQSPEVLLGNMLKCVNRMTYVQLPQPK